MDCSLQAPLSMRFSRQEYWSGLPFLSPGDLPDPGIKPGSPVLQADSLLSEPPGKTSVPRAGGEVGVGVMVESQTAESSDVNHSSGKGIDRF